MMGKYDPIAEVREFSVALAQAVHDARHEGSSQRLLHFWDTDSLILPALGLPALRGRTQTDEELLAQALFSAGLLGRVRLLAPHKGEFLHNLAGWRADPTGRGRDQLALDEFLGGQELNDVTSAVDALDSINAGVPARDAVKRLSQLSYRSFVHVEASAGNWPQRVSRLLSEQLIDLQQHGASMRELVECPEYAKINAKLTEVRERDRGLATAIDAAALTSLVRLNVTPAGAAKGEYPRFFTSSRHLGKLYREWEWLQERLAFDVPNGTPKSAGTVWRESTYYFVRAIFPSLGVAGSNAELAVRNGPSLDSLEQLACDLDDALEFGDRELGKVLERKLFDDDPDGRTLAQLIASRKRSRMSVVWRSYEGSFLPDEIARTLARLRELSRMTSVVEATRVMEMELDDQIRTHLSVIQSTSSLFRAIETSLSVLVKVKERSISLKHDLGSSRFGTEYPDDDPYDLIEAVEVRERFVLDRGKLLALFDPDGLSSDPEVVLRAAVVLICVERFDEGRRLLVTTGNWDSSERHRLVFRIATVGSREGMDEDRLADLVAQAKTDWGRLGSNGDADPLLSLGYAYLVFLAWQRSAPGGAWSFSNPRDPLGWVDWCLERVADCRTQLSDIGQLQATNLLLYMSACADAPVDKFDDLLRDLEGIAKDRDDFHLLDTVGFSLLRRARSMVPAQASSAVTRAVGYLERAHRLFPDDTEVAQHLELAREFRPARR